MNVNFKPVGINEFSWQDSTQIELKIVVLPKGENNITVQIVKCICLPHK